MFKLHLKELIYEHFMYFAIFVRVSFYSQASFVIKFNVFNFFKWCEQIQFHLGVLNLNLALLNDKYPVVNDSSNANKGLLIRLMRDQIC